MLLHRLWLFWLLCQFSTSQRRIVKHTKRFFFPAVWDDVFLRCDWRHIASNRCFLYLCWYSNKSLLSACFFWHQCLFWGCCLSPSSTFSFVSKGIMQIPPASSPHTSKWDMTEEEVVRPCLGMKKEEEAREDGTITLLTYRTELIPLGEICDVTLHCTLLTLGRQCTWLEPSSRKTCFVCWVVKYFFFFFFFYQHDMLNCCFASSICLLQDHCNLLMWKKISRAHGLVPAFCEGEQHCDKHTAFGYYLASPSWPALYLSC